MQIYDAADYTGTGAAASLASILGLTGINALAKWFQVTTVSGTFTNLPRVGSSSISTSRGIPITGSQFVPPIAEETNQYNLANIYLRADVGDVLSVAYAI